MRILGIDTATKFLSLGVYNNGKIYEYNLELGTGLSLWLVATIKRVLDVLGWQASSIDYFACGLGPGSFTVIPSHFMPLTFTRFAISVTIGIAATWYKKDVPKRIIPIVISKEIDFVKLFMDYWVTLIPGEVIFKMTRQNAWKIINRELKLYNHFLIHERCTHLVTSQAFTDLDLKQFRGWTDTRPASIYTHLKWQDLAKKMG